jgi:hypothetical protein
MTDPRRLSDVGNAFERTLLRSARRDHGSSAAEARCVVAATTTAAVAAHAGSAAASTAASAIAKTALGTAGIGASITAKAVAIGFAVGLTVQGTIVVSNHVSKPAAPRLVDAAAHPMAPSAQDVPPPALALRPEPAELADAPQDSVETPQSHVTQSAHAPQLSSGHSTVQSPEGSRNAAPRAPSPSSTPETTESSPGASVANNDMLDREVAIIDEARLACRANSHERALALIDLHRLYFAHGSLGPEALVIRVQALVGLGRHEEATRLALPFISTYASSPISQRLRAILSQNQSPR